MNVKNSVFVICIEVIKYLLLYYFHDYAFKRIWNFYKTTSANFWLSATGNINSENHALQTLKIRPRNITFLQKTKNVTNSKNYIFLIVRNEYNVMMTCRLTCRKTKMCPLNTNFLQNFSFRTFLTNVTSLYLDKRNKRFIYEKIHIVILVGLTY